MKFAAALIGIWPIWAQGVHTGPVSASGTCVLANSGTITTATLNCTNLTPEQKKLLSNIPQLLNKVLASQAESSAEILSRLDTCVAGVTELREGYWNGHTSKELDAFSDALGAFPPAKVGIIVANGEDHNRGILALELRTAIKKAKWEATISYPQILFGPDSQLPRGLVIGVKQDSLLVQGVGKALIDLIGKENVSGNIEKNFMDPSIDLQITIWSRVSK